MAAPDAPARGDLQVFMGLGPTEKIVETGQAVDAAVAIVSTRVDVSAGWPDAVWLAALYVGAKLVKRMDLPSGEEVSGYFAIGNVWDPTVEILLTPYLKVDNFA